jgi:NADH-quinone oxidoreductase subunit N
VLLVSLAGIPPLLGFWGKFQVFASAITLSGRMFLDSGNALLGWTYGLLAVIGIVGSVVSLAYYGSVLQSLYSTGGPDDTKGPELADLPRHGGPDVGLHRSLESSL